MDPRRTGLALTALLLLAACGGVRGVPDSGRGIGGPRASEARAMRPGGGADIAALTLAAAPPGATLPFGQVATACGVGEGALGPAIEEAAGFAIHDTAPGGTELRTHYITGFADGCPRQVTAALAVFGDPAVHEMLRYGMSEAGYDATDNAYETIKGQVCGARAGQPCGEAIDSLSQDTAFVSLYPVFGGEDSADILLHAGEVVASDLQ